MQARWQEYWHWATFPYITIYKPYSENSVKIKCKYVDCVFYNKILLFGFFRRTTTSVYVGNIHRLRLDVDLDCLKFTFLLWRKVIFIVIISITLTVTSGFR